MFTTNLSENTKLNNIVKFAENYNNYTAVNLTKQYSKIPQFLFCYIILLKSGLNLLCFIKAYKRPGQRLFRY